MATWSFAVNWVSVAAGVAGIAGIATGTALLLVPRRLLGEGAALRRLLFETNVGDLFNRRFSIERRVYRRHRVAGAIVLCGALAALALVWWFLEHPKRLSWLLGLSTPIAGRGLMLLLATAGVLLAVVGTCLLVRPSVLKGVEAAVNRWIDPIPAGNPHMMVSRWVLAAPRVTGSILVAAGAACLGFF